MSALASNIDAQIKRLRSQMEDLEEMKDDLDADEYEKMKLDTLEQLAVFESKRVQTNSLTLLSGAEIERNAKQQDTASKSQASSRITKLKAGSASQIRAEINSLTSFVQMGKMTKKEFDDKVGQLVFSLQKLGERLTEDEVGLLEQVGPNNLKAFEAVSGEVNSSKLNLKKE